MIREKKYIIMNIRHTKLKNEDDKIKPSEYWQERTVFPGVVPREVKFLVKNISNIEKNFFRKLIKVALGYLQGTLSHEKCELAFENLCRAKSCQSEEDVINLSVQYSGVVTLLRAVLKLNLKTVREDTLMQDLKDLGLPEEFSLDVCKVVFGPARGDIMSEIIAHNPHHPKIEAFEWNVAVTLSNTWSSKVLEPSVNLTVKTSDGEFHNFELSIEAFHLMRQSTATILRQMEFLERRK